MFPKIGVPQNGWFIMENPIKMDHLEYHYFWKHPYIFGIYLYMWVNHIYLFRPYMYPHLFYPNYLWLYEKRCCFDIYINLQKSISINHMIPPCRQKINQRCMVVGTIVISSIASLLEWPLCFGILDFFVRNQWITG